MNLPFFIAFRYLFAKKSHNVINIISAISAIGMAIGTAVLIIILSVYNGFNSLIEDSLGQTAPDVLITPAEGKFFIPDSKFADIGKDESFFIGTKGIVEENLFLSYDGRQGLARARGIEDENMYRGEIPLCAVGASTASSLDINPRFVASLELYYPTKERDVSIANPLSSLNSAKVHPERIFNTSTSVQDPTLIVPVDIMRDLLELSDNEVSAVEVWIDRSISPKQLKDAIKSIKDTFSPDEFTVRDRYEQNEALFKMMKYEKAAIYLILIFIVIIITFNIFGSLTMLIIEKEGDIQTLHSMGATPQMLRRTFTIEGWLISLLGLGAGLVTGLLFAFLQQQFGIIKMPGNFIVNAYPVIIEAGDIVITAVSVALVGYLIAAIPAHKHIA